MAFNSTAHSEGVWLDAYMRGRNKYEFNDDESPVFNAKGRPIVPQVDRTEMRRASGFVSFARERLDSFEVFDDPKRIELGEEDAFYGYLEAHLSDVTLGDAILIKGKAPWDRRYVHFHSFFVYETDPVTGMPIVIVGNAGRPSLRVWQTEVRRTPQRAIVHRIRFKTSWLESIVDVRSLDAARPLAAGPD